MFLPKRLIGVPTPMNMKPSPPPDNRVLTQVPIMVRRSVMPLMPGMKGKLQLLGGVKRPIKFM